MILMKRGKGQDLLIKLGSLGCEKGRQNVHGTGDGGKRTQGKWMVRRRKDREGEQGMRYFH